MGGPRPALTHQQAQHLASVVRPFVEQYVGSATAMARAWQLSQSQLSQILSARGRGAGLAVLCRIRLHTGMSLDELLGLPPVGRRSAREQGQR
jgi:hypothetical protein